MTIPAIIVILFTVAAVAWAAGIFIGSVMDYWAMRTKHNNQRKQP